MERPRSLVVGHITHDRYGEDIAAGGCAFYGARAHAALGADVHLVATVGEDFRCDAELTGLPHTLTRGGTTTTFTNLYPEGRVRLQLVEEQAPDVVPGTAPSGLWDLLHLAPVLQEIDLLRWRSAVDARLVGINVQGWIKVAGSRPEMGVPEGGGADARVVVQKRWSPSKDDLGGIDVACVSDEDLVGQGDLLERLVESIAVVAHTHGADGADIIEGGRTTRIGVYRTDAVDPTGAGDTFAAALMHALACGRDAVSAGRLAAAAASIVVEGKGGSTLERLGEAAARAEQLTA
jgi:sugar/nucleoside kinase (ribokinase family)